MIIKTIDQFDLRQIAESGQCFRMGRIEPAELEGKAAGKWDMAYRVISGSRMLTIVQTGDRVGVLCGEKEFAFWEDYFDLRTDYGRFIAAIDPADHYLKAAADYGNGIRILRQDLWEMIITFVISQQKTIPNIRALVESLCRRYGSEIRPDEPKDEQYGPKVRQGGADKVFYAFPSPEQLTCATLDDLLKLKLGYRAKYIKKLCEDACLGVLDLRSLKEMPYPLAMEYLCGFYGIGEKVANCVCLFGLHHIEAFPIDTWIRRILEREYLPNSHLPAGCPKTRVWELLAAEHFSGYTGYAGVMQQYMFYYEIHCGKTKRV